MGQFLNMPKLDMSMEEGKLLKWMCSEGDVIIKGDPAFEVETGKVNLEVDSIVEGTIIKIYRTEGDVVPVNTPVAFVGKKGEIAPNLQENAEEEVAAIKEKPVEVDEQITKNPNNKENEYDLCVIGGGPGGYVAAIRASQMGAKVALVERNKLGGTCLNWGCIPTKSLVHHSHIWDNIQHCNELGFEIKNMSFDWEKIISQKDDVVHKLRSGVGGLLAKNNVDVIEGDGIIKSKNLVCVGEREIIAQNIIIATGTEASTLDIPTDGRVKFMDIKEVLDMKELPKRMTIVGGGVIGVEIASILASFGVEVSILEMMPRILSMLDNDITDLLTEELDKKGVYVKTNTKITGVEEFKGQYIINLDDKKQIYTDSILIAVGRTPNTEAFNDININLDNKGYIVVDSNLKTNIENIYAIGDITNKIQLAHVASHQGIVAVENIFGSTKSMTYSRVPNCIFTDPEIGVVGLTEEEAKKENIPVNVFKFPFSALGKAMAIRDTRGFVKLIVDDRWNEIVGAHIIGPDATKLIAEIVAVMELEGTVDDLSNIIHAHPTLSEGIMEAASGILGRAIHI